MESFRGSLPTSTPRIISAALSNRPHLMDRNQNEDEIFGKQDGFVAITKSRNGKILNSGKSRAGLANPAADAAFFFSVSDQIETEITVAISFNADPGNPVKRCCGLMLQAMPDCDLELPRNLPRPDEH